MNKTTEALKRVEVWVESLTGLHTDVRQEQGEILAAIREALAEPDMNLNCPSVQARLATIWGYVKAEQEKQKPVAYCCGFENTHPDGWIDCKIFRDGEFTTPLYAAPVSAKREWVDLTDDEINKLIQAWYKSNDGLFGYASAVIAAFKDKNN